MDRECYEVRRGKQRTKTGAIFFFATKGGVAFFSGACCTLEPLLGLYEATSAARAGESDAIPKESIDRTIEAEKK